MLFPDGLGRIWQSGALALWLLVGCQANKSASLSPPRATFAVEQFKGTPVSGPLAEPLQPPRPEDALAVNVTLVALDQVPGDALEPLSAHAKLIAVTQGGLPVQPSATLTSGARFGVAEQAAAFRERLASRPASGAVELYRLSRAVPPGTTAVFGADEPGKDAPRRVAVEVSFPAEPGAAPTVWLALLVEDTFVPPASPPEESDQANPASQPTSPPAPQFHRETVVLDNLNVGERLQATIVAPFAFTESRAGAMAFLIDVSPGSADEAHVQAVNRSVTELARSAEFAGKRPIVGPLQIDAYSALLGMVPRLSDPATRRAALVYLCSESGAELCGDVALAADDALLKTLSERIVARSSAPDAPRTADAFGWTFDEVTLQLLTELSGSNKLPPEMSAVLSLHAGEAGRHASSLEQVSRGVSSRQDFENRLIAENLIFLEDNSPASRVRAYDWLRAVGRAPADYDPLGAPKQRRQALDRAVTVASSPTTQQARP